MQTSRTLARDEFNKRLLEVKLGCLTVQEFRKHVITRVQEFASCSIPCAVTHYVHALIAAGREEPYLMLLLRPERRWMTEEL